MSAGEELVCGTTGKLYRFGDGQWKPLDSGGCTVWLFRDAASLKARVVARCNVTQAYVLNMPFTTEVTHTTAGEEYVQWKSATETYSLCCDQAVHRDSVADGFRTILSFLSAATSPPPPAAASLPPVSTSPAPASVPAATTGPPPLSVLPPPPGAAVAAPIPAAALAAPLPPASAPPSLVVTHTSSEAALTANMPARSASPIPALKMQSVVRASEPQMRSSHRSTTSPAVRRRNVTIDDRSSASSVEDVPSLSATPEAPPCSRASLTLQPVDETASSESSTSDASPMDPASRARIMHKRNDSIKGSHKFFGGSTEEESSPPVTLKKSRKSGKTLRGSRRRVRDDVKGKGLRRGSTQIAMTGVVEGAIQSLAVPPSGLLTKPADQCSKRELVVRELYSTERTFVTQLVDIFQVCVPLSRDPRPLFDSEVEFRIWGNLDQILGASRRLFDILTQVCATWDANTSTLGNIFSDQISMWTPYKTYYANYNDAIRLLDSLGKHKSVAQYLSNCQTQCKGLALQSLLVTPVQRIPRYRLLLQEYAKHVPADHPDAALTTRAVEAVNKFANLVNEGVRVLENKEEFKRLCKQFQHLKAIRAPLVKSDLKLDITVGQERAHGLVLFVDRLVVGMRERDKFRLVVEQQLDLVWTSNISDTVFSIRTPTLDILVTTDLAATARAWVDTLRIEEDRYCSNKRLVTGPGVRTMTNKYMTHVYEGDWVDAQPHGKGKMFLDGGNVYEGDFVAGEFHGEGTLFYKKLGDNARYVGAWIRGQPQGRGELYLPGRTYTGDFEAGQPHGIGTAAGPWSTYVGQWERGLYHGIGTLTASDGTHYEGTWRKGLRHGHGKLVTDAGVYDGDFEDDRRHGMGKQSCDNGDLYDGPWVNDLRHGDNGSLIMKDGSTYVGSWAQGEFEGSGVYTQTNGIRYEGQWKSGKRHGEGKQTWLNGQVYEGGWADNRFSGHGKLVSAGGATYEGQWHAGKRFGEGKQQFVAEGVAYEGAWIKDRMEGKGVLTFANGAKYEGAMVSGKRGGLGTYTSKDGSVRYEGHWAQDRFDGKGTLVVANTYHYEGMWRAGCRHGAGVERLSELVTLKGTFVDDRRDGDATLCIAAAGGKGAGTDVAVCFQDGALEPRFVSLVPPTILPPPVLVDLCFTPQLSLQ